MQNDHSTYWVDWDTDKIVYQYSNAQIVNRATRFSANVKNCGQIFKTNKSKNALNYLSFIHIYFQDWEWL